MTALDRRRTAACAALLMIFAAGATGCARNQHSASSNLGGIGAPATSPTSGVDATDNATPTDDATPTDSATPTDGSTPTTAPPVTVSVKVTGVTTAYTGLCQPPSSATKFKAVITVNHGPATVHFRWRTSNNGDYDPSTQTATFGAGGYQTRTVYHNEASYPPAPYPASFTDWAAVVLLDHGGATSNHVAFSIKCLPFTVKITGVVTHYDGPCPPPASGSTAITLSGVINATENTTVTFHWRSSNGGDSDPNDIVATVTGGVPYTFHHYEHFYPPSPYPATTNDWIAVDAGSAGYSVQSNHVPITITCEP